MSLLQYKKNSHNSSLSPLPQMRSRNFHIEIRPSLSLDKQLRRGKQSLSFRDIPPNRNPKLPKHNRSLHLFIPRLLP